MGAFPGSEPFSPRNRSARCSPAASNSIRLLNRQIAARPSPQKSNPAKARKAAEDGSPRRKPGVRSEDSRKALRGRFQPKSPQSGRKMLAPGPSLGYIPRIPASRKGRIQQKPAKRAPEGSPRRKPGGPNARRSPAPAGGERTMAPGSRNEGRRHDAATPRIGAKPAHLPRPRCR